MDSFIIEIRLVNTLLLTDLFSDTILLSKGSKLVTLTTPFYKFGTINCTLRSCLIGNIKHIIKTIITLGIFLIMIKINLPDDTVCTTAIYVMMAMTILVNISAQDKLRKRFPLKISDLLNQYGKPDKTITLFLVYSGNNLNGFFTKHFTITKLHFFGKTAILERQGRCRIIKLEDIIPKEQLLANTDFALRLDNKIFLYRSLSSDVYSMLFK